MRSTLALSALAAAAAATPVSLQYRVLSFTINNNSTLVNAEVLNNGVGGQYVLQAVDPSVSAGSKFYFAGNGTISLDMVFPLDNGAVAGATAPEVGDEPGYAAPVIATQGSQGDGEWAYSNTTNELTHELRAALESLFSCTEMIGAENATVLSWGNPSSTPDGLVAPEGCEYTTVYVSDYVPPIYE